MDREHKLVQQGQVKYQKVTFFPQNNYKNIQMLSGTMRKNNKSKIDMREYCITVDYNDVQGIYSEC